MLTKPFLVPWAGWLVSAWKFWLAEVLPCIHLAPAHSALVREVIQTAFALPRAQNTFVPLKTPTINWTWVVCDWSLQQWLGCSSQGRAGLGHPSTQRDTHPHPFPSSAPAQPWYCCSSSSLHLQGAAHPQCPAQLLSWHHASLPDQRREHMGHIPHLSPSLFPAFFPHPAGY